MAEEVDKPIQHRHENAEIICGICQEKPSHPKLLSCCHVCCMTCLQRYIDANSEHGNVRCPLCRTLIKINTDGAFVGVTDLFVKITSEEVGMCEVCETSQTVSSCLECAQNYCETCAELHSKMKISREHHIIPNGNMLLQNKKRSSSFCKKHESELLHYFCIDCKEPICFKCNMTKHKNHRCDDIIPVAESKRKYLEKEILENVKCRVVILEDRLQKYKYQMHNIEDKYSKQTEMMKERVTMLKTRIDEQMKSLINSLRENVDNYAQVLQNREGVIENELRALKAKSCYVRQCIDFAGDAELMKILPGLEDGPLMRDRSIWLEENANIEYSPPNVSDAQIKEMIGVPSMGFALSSLIQLEKLSEFKVDKQIEGICGISPDTVWISYGQWIQKFTKHRGACDKVDIKEYVYGVVMNIDGEIYVACLRSIRMVNADLSVVICFNLPFCPSGIAINEEDNICVCFSASRRISMYSKEGKPYLELHQDSCQGMPQKPLKIAISFQEIYVTDFSGNEDVTVISLEGAVRKKMKQGQMDPFGLAISRQGYVFVTDRRNKSIQIFNKEGICLSTLNVNISVTNICIVSQNEIWIGAEDGNIHVLRLLVSVSKS